MSQFTRRVNSFTVTSRIQANDCVKLGQSVREPKSKTSLTEGGKTNYLCILGLAVFIQCYKM